MPPKASQKTYRLLWEEAEQENQNKDENVRYSSKLDERKKKIYSERDSQCRRKKKAREKAQLENTEKANDEATKKALTKKWDNAALRQRKCRERASCYAII